MSNVQIDWTLPTARTDNRALPVSEIAFTRFTLSFNGGAFTQLVDIPAPNATTTLSPNLAPGNYVIRSVVYDKQSPPKLSSQVDTSFVIPAVVVALAAPKPVAGQTAVVS